MYYFDVRCKECGVIIEMNEYEYQYELEYGTLDEVICECCIHERREAQYEDKLLCDGCSD